MKVVGLTGGVGMGKSTCSDLIRVRNLPVVDTDELARQIVGPGQPALAEIARSFGSEFIDSNGRLRRRALARRIFADAAERKILEDILHPRIRRLWHAQVDAWREEGQALAVVVIPLLFETGAESELDVTVCVACSKGVQEERLAARGWPPEQVRQRIAAQMPIESKMAQADFVIWNDADVAVHAAQLDRILAALRSPIL